MQAIEVPVRLAEIAARQRRIVRRAQLLAGGVSRDTLAWQVRKKRWQRLLPGIYALFSGRVAEEERFVAAALHGGDGAQITGAAALRWHGLQYAPNDAGILLNVLPGGRRVASRGFVQVIRTERPDRLSLFRHGFEVCSVGRSVADAARRATSVADVRAMVAEAVQRGQTSVGELFDELDAGPPNGSAIFRRVLREIGDGIRSRPEAEFRALLGRSAVLPALLWNPVLVTGSGERLPTPDGWIDEGAIALEVDSQEFHFGLAGWERTMNRRNVLEAKGVAVLSFSPKRIRLEPGNVLRMVEEAYRSRSGTKADIVARSASSPRDSTRSMRH